MKTSSKNTSSKISKIEYKIQIELASFLDFFEKHKDYPTIVYKEIENITKRIIKLK